MKISDYKSLVFDCDGVVLDSNRVKTEAFYFSTLPYGELAAKAMVKHHVANGGVSRYEKFSHFLNYIVPKQSIVSHKEQLNELLDNYASHVREGLAKCDIAPGLKELRSVTPCSRWLIVSGGDQAELRLLFTQRGIAKWFDGGVFGSPDTKDEILQRELNSGNIQEPALFLGDSKYDYEASSSAGIDFVFLSGWSEVPDWERWAESLHLSSYSYLSDFI